ncbi:MAG: acyltransferase [Lachnospiraceae bacterium]|nr:acyltransferase [Lachnospiraceae bacterium]
MRTIKDKEYATVIGYGLGQYYEKVKEELFQIMTLDFVCDRKWENSDKKEYDGIPLLKRGELKNFQKAIVIVFIGSTWVYETVKRDLDELGIESVHVDEVIGANCNLSGAMLKENYPNGAYEDKRGNKIYFDQSIPEKIRVSFQGHNNVLQVGKNVLAGNLYIRFGNNGICNIGNNTEIIGAEFYVSDAKIKIGQDCLFSTQVILRTHDAHHIFELNTHQRINYAKDIVVEDNVWIAFRCTLLGGAKIGVGSVVGTNTVTSGHFDDHRIIAGSPGRVIKENICWSRDNTEYFNHNSLEECKSQEMLKYI